MRKESSFEVDFITDGSKILVYLMLHHYMIKKKIGSFAMVTNIAN